MADFTRQELDAIIAKGGSVAAAVAALQNREIQKKKEDAIKNKTFDSLTNKQFNDIKAFLNEVVLPADIIYDVNSMVKNINTYLEANDKDAFLREILVLLRTLKAVNVGV